MNRRALTITAILIAACVAAALVFNLRKAPVVVRDSPAPQVVAEARATPAPLIETKQPAQVAPATPSAERLKENQVEVKGRVLTGSTPTAGAAVKIVAYQLKQAEVTAMAPVMTESGGDGTFRAVVEDCQYVAVFASLDGVGRGTASGVVTPDKRQVSMDVYLLPVAALSGRVVDESDAPVAGARLWVMREFGKNVIVRNPGQMRPPIDGTISGEDGTFRFGGAPEGLVKIAAQADGFTGATVEATAPATDVVVKLSRGGFEIAGLVFVKPSGLAAEGATVEIIGESVALEIPRTQREATTDASGAFRFDGLPAGFYDVTVKKDGLIRYIEPTPAGPRMRLMDLVAMVGSDDAEATEKARNMEVFLYPGHAVSGVVTDSATNTPLPGVKVTQTGLPARSTAPVAESVTDADGKYRLTGLSGGGANLDGEKEGYLMDISSRQEGFYAAFAADNYEATLDFKMVAGVAIVGRVVNESKIGVPGAKVFVADEGVRMAMAFSYQADRTMSGSATTAADGTFSLLVRPNTKSALGIDAPGFYRTITSEEYQVYTEPLAGVEIVLKAPASVSGRVLGPDGQPFQGAVVDAQFMMSFGRGMGGEGARYSTSAAKSTSGADGRFVISGLEPKEYTINASHRDHSPGTAIAVVLEPRGAKTGLEFQLGTGHFVAGRVVDKEGKPMTQMNVFASVKSSDGSERSSGGGVGPDGKFRINELPEGELTIRLSEYNGNQSKEFENQPLDRDDLELVFDDVAKATFIGKIVDGESMKSLPTAKVTRSMGMQSDIEVKADGSFELKERKGMWVQLQIEVPGYATLKSGGFMIQGGEEPQVETFKMFVGTTITGRAVSRADRKPVADARVELYMENTAVWSSTNALATATTDAEGRFTISPAIPGRRVLQFVPRAPYSSRRYPITVGSETADAGDVELGQGSTIVARALELPGQTPVEGKTIVAAGTAFGAQGTTRSEKTDARGEVRFMGLPTGSYRLTIPGEGAEATVSEIQDDETREVVLVVGSGVLKGTITDMDSSPFAVLMSTVYNGTRQERRDIAINPNGTFEVAGLAAGNWRVSIQFGSQSFEEDVQIPSGQTVERTFELATGAMRVRVVDAAGNPVTDATLTVRLVEDAKANPMRLRESDGVFLANGLKPGSYLVLARHEKLGTAEGTASVVAGAVPVEATVTLSGAATGSLTSTAIRLTDSQPIPRAWCRISSESGANYTDNNKGRDSNGVVTIENLPVGKYLVVVSNWGHSEGRHNIEIRAGETAEITDVLYEAGSVQWAIADRDGAPVVGAVVTFTPADPNSIEEARMGRTDRDGMWEDRGLFPGEYIAEATLADGRRVTDRIRIAAHEHSEKATVAP